METTEYAATIWEGDGEIQPEGGLDLSDLLDDGEFGSDRSDAETGAGDGEVKAEDDSSKPDGTDEASAPTTGQTEPPAGSEADEATPTTEFAEEATPQKLKFTAKVDRKEQNVEMDFSDLPGLYQRAQNYDRLAKKYDTTSAKLQSLEALSAQLGYDSLEAMVEQACQSDREAKVKALVDEGTPLSIAEDYVDRSIEKARSSRKVEEEEADLDESTDSQPASENEEKRNELDFKSQVEELFRARPDLKGTLKRLPEEVSRAVVENHVPLRAAYAEWEAQQMKAENDRIRKEKDLFAQQAETAARAPVRGTVDGKIEEKEKPDKYVEGFRSEMEW